MRCQAADTAAQACADAPTPMVAPGDELALAAAPLHVRVGCAARVEPCIELAAQAGGDDVVGAALGDEGEEDADEDDEPRSVRRTTPRGCCARRTDALLQPQSRGAYSPGRGGDDDNDDLGGDAVFDDVNYVRSDGLRAERHTKVLLSFNDRTDNVKMCRVLSAVANRSVNPELSAALLATLVDFTEHPLLHAVGPKPARRPDGADSDWNSGVLVRRDDGKANVVTVFIPGDSGCGKTESVKCVRSCAGAGLFVLTCRVGRHVIGELAPNKVIYIDLLTATVEARASVRQKVTATSIVLDALFLGYRNYVVAAAKSVGSEADPEELYTTPALLAAALRKQGAAAAEAAGLRARDVDAPLIALLSRLGFIFVFDECDKVDNNLIKVLLEVFVEMLYIPDSLGKNSITLLPNVLHTLIFISNVSPALSPTIVALGEFVLKPKALRLNEAGEQLVPPIELIPSEDDVEHLSLKRLTRVLRVNRSVKAAREGVFRELFTSKGVHEKMLCRMVAASLLPATIPHSPEERCRTFAQDVADNVAALLLDFQEEYGYSGVEVRCLISGVSADADVGKNGRTAAYAARSAGDDMGRDIVALFEAGTLESHGGVLHVNITSRSMLAEEAVGLRRAGGPRMLLDSPGLAHRVLSSGAGVKYTTPAGLFVSEVKAGRGGVAVAWARTKGPAVLEQVVIANTAGLLRWAVTDTAMKCAKSRVGPEFLGSLLPVPLVPQYVSDTMGATLSLREVFARTCCRIVAVVIPHSDHSPEELALMDPNDVFKLGGEPMPLMCMFNVTGDGADVDCCGTRLIGGIRLPDHGAGIGRSGHLLFMESGFEMLGASLGGCGETACRSYISAFHAALGGELSGRAMSIAASRCAPLRLGVAPGLAAVPARVTTREQFLAWVRSDHGVLAARRLGEESTWTPATAIATRGARGSGGDGSIGSIGGGAFGGSGSGGLGRDTAMGGARRGAEGGAQGGAGAGGMRNARRSLALMGPPSAFDRFGLDDDDQVADGAHAGAWLRSQLRSQRLRHCCAGAPRVSRRL